MVAMTFVCLIEGTGYRVLGTGWGKVTETSGASGKTVLVRTRFVGSRFPTSPQYPVTYSE